MRHLLTVMTLYLPSKVVSSYFPLINQRVHSSSATLIDNIFLNTPHNITVCGNIISSISDHFSQFCILKTARDKIKIKNLKMRHFSSFSIDDLSNVNWNALFVNDLCDVNSVFSSFYNKFKKLINKHAPMKTISKCKAKLLSKPWITIVNRGEWSWNPANLLASLSFHVWGWIAPPRDSDCAQTKPVFLNIMADTNDWFSSETILTLRYFGRRRRAWWTV